MSQGHTVTQRTKVVEEHYGNQPAGSETRGSPGSTSGSDYAPGSMIPSPGTTRSIPSSTSVGSGSSVRYSPESAYGASPVRSGSSYQQSPVSSPYTSSGMSSGGPFSSGVPETGLGTSFEDPNRTPPPIPPGPANTNVVLPVLQNMLRVIDYGVNVMWENRNSRLNEALEFLATALKNGDNSVQMYLTFRDKMKKYFNQLEPLVEMWSDLLDYYEYLVKQCEDIYQPIPNLYGVAHSTIVSQKAYKDLLLGAVSFTNEAIRFCQIDQVAVSQFADLADRLIRKNQRSLKNFVEPTIQFFIELEPSVNEMVRIFVEKQVLVDLYIKEWQRGDPKLNQPKAPDMYVALPTFPDLSDHPTPGPPRVVAIQGRAASPQAPPPSRENSPFQGAGLRGQYDVNTSTSSSSVSGGRPRSARPMATRGARLRSPDGTSASPASTPYSGSQPSSGPSPCAANMESIISNFDDMERGAFNQFQSMRGQRENFNCTAAALKGLENSSPPPFA